MDHEKKYKEALEKARKLCAYPTTKPFISDLQDLFPELKESDGEKIKEICLYAIKNYFNEHYNDWDNVKGFPKNDIISWLEKQGQTFTKKDVDDAYLKGVCDTKQELEKQGEQKLAWSKEDEETLKDIITSMTNLKDSATSDALRDIYNSKIAWLKSLKDRVIPQPKQEWSEENEKCIRLSTDIIDSSLRAGFCVQLDRDRCVDWLKSLRPNHWKPSDEQMKVLDMIRRMYNYEELDSLYNDLKKLKDEK